MSLQQKCQILHNISSRVFTFKINIVGSRQFSNNKEMDKEENNSNKKENEDRNKSEEKPKEFNGPKGQEPTRYGDWERKGR
uniref:Succinate dehydrogenase assembly factor 4, mitochondrial n=1 Tax=Meloidogyne hapla TaxID=6305 RepID=A0A1I8BMA9_MELHA